jgi:excisionase family DNA binding protein
MSMTLPDLLREHGIDATEDEIAQATEAGLGWVLTAPGTTALPTDEAALLDAAGLPDQPGAYARAAATATGAYAALVSTALTISEAATLLGVTEGRVRHRIARRDLHALRSGRKRLPRWQFTDDGVLPGLPAVLRGLTRDEHPLATLAFMTTRQPELDLGDGPVSPERWLRAGGDPAPVAALATARR